METVLDEAVIDEMISQAIMISGVSYSDEEREAKVKGWNKAVKYSFEWAKED